MFARVMSAVGHMPFRKLAKIKQYDALFAEAARVDPAIGGGAVTTSSSASTDVQVVTNGADEGESARAAGGESGAEASKGSTKTEAGASEGTTTAASALELQSRYERPSFKKHNHLHHHHNFGMSFLQQDVDFDERPRITHTHDVTVSYGDDTSLLELDTTLGYGKK